MLDRLDASGNPQTITAFDAYGTEHAAYGTPSDPFGYNARSGYYQDRETGLYLCQHRFYDPANGRWLNRDPIGFAGGTNLYAYCAGGPVGAVDPQGKRMWSFQKWLVADNGYASDEVYDSALLALDDATSRWLSHFGTQQRWAVPVGTLGAVGLAPIPKAWTPYGVQPGARRFTSLPRLMGWKCVARSLKSAVARPLPGSFGGDPAGETPAGVAWFMLVEAAAAVTAGVQTYGEPNGADPGVFVSD